VTCSWEVSKRPITKATEDETAFETTGNFDGTRRKVRSRLWLRTMPADGAAVFRFESFCPRSLPQTDKPAATVIMKTKVSLNAVDRLRFIKIALQDANRGFPNDVTRRCMYVAKFWNG
jgi:hypothetical protein